MSTCDACKRKVGHRADECGTLWCSGLPEAPDNTERIRVLREALGNSRVMLLLCRGTVAMNIMPGIEVVLQNIDEALKY